MKKRYRVLKTKLLHLPVVDKNFKLLKVRSFELLKEARHTISYDLNAQLMHGGEQIY